MTREEREGPAIEVRDLCKEFPKTGRSGARVHAVSGVNFTVEHGSRLAFIGPNGAGKSTSIKMLTGILRPTSGAASVLGLTPWEDRKRLAQKIGTLFGQRSQLWFQLTPRRTYELLATIYGVPRGVATSRLSGLGELLDAGRLYDRPVRTLSLGERMRCELVASLLHAPEVLFLDEPTIGLDLVAKTRFRDLVVTINEEQGTTIFLTSHDVSDIEQVAKRVIVINHGKVIYDDSVAKLRRALLKTKVVDVRFESPAESCDIEGATLVKLTPSGAKLEVDTERVPIRQVLDQLLDRFSVVDISVIDPPLEDVVSHIYTREA